MDHSSICLLIGLSIILLNISIIESTPLIFNDSLESSGQWESGGTDLLPTPSPFSLLNTSDLSTSLNGEKHPKPFIDQVVDFFQENLLLVVVITTLLLLIFTIICSAAILSRRRKVSVYYPCAFPSKMYVDERDKTGGGKFFNEVPENVNTSSCEEPLNSAKQLQEDIMLATKNLRTPVKTPWREKNEAVEDQKSADDVESLQCHMNQNESSSLQEDMTTCQSVEDSVEKSKPRMSQGSVPVSDMEKCDPSESGHPDENKHPFGPEIREDMNKQDVVNSGTSVISEEKTAF